MTDPQKAEKDTFVIYLQCVNCYQIEPESSWLTGSTGPKCKHCEAVDEHQQWPSAEIRELFETTRQYNQSASEYGLVTSVFVSAALELLLERLIFTVAMEDLLYEEGAHLVDLLLDTNQGRARRLRLFNRLGYLSFRKETEVLGYQQFLRHWDEIVETRNKSVHGQFKESYDMSSLLLNTTISEALEVFSKLHNKYNEESLAFKAVVGWKEDLKHDLDNLRRWQKSVTGLMDTDDEE